MSTASIELALGTVQFGLAYGVVGSGQQVSDAEAHRILARAAEHGIRVLDTAAAYGDIEQRLAGLAGEQRFRVVSKIPPVPKDLEGAAAADFVQQALQRSHQRLGGLLGAVLFHSADDLLGDQGDLLWQAAARHAAPLGVQLGVSCYGPAQLQTLRGRYPITIAQLPGNVLDQRLVGHDFGGIELHLRSAFLQGLLLAPAEQGGARLPAAAAHLVRWQERCVEQGLSPLTAALSAVKALPGVRCCVVGVESVAQLDEIATAWSRATPVAWADLATEEPGVIDPRVWKKAA